MRPVASQFFLIKKCGWGQAAQRCTTRGVNLMGKPRYSDFVYDIDIDAFENAIDFTPVEQRGDNDIGHCPDVWGLHKHGDTTGKFAIHRDKRVYNCWVCGGGSLLSLTMEMFSMEIDAATEWLRQFAHGDKRSDGEFEDYFMSLLEDVERHAATMPYFNDKVLKQFDDDPSWFKTRGINDEVIETYGLCYGEMGMKSAPVKERNGHKVKIDEDYYGPTAVFPHFWEGRLVGWQNRWMDWTQEHSKTPKWLAKYTNTTDFPKSITLFNYDRALEARKPLVVCESVPTVLLLASFEVPAVSFFGSEPKEAQLRLLRKAQAGVILAPDNDSNGDKLLRVATDYLQNYIKVQHLPKITKAKGADLGDLVKDEFREAKETLWQALSYHLEQAKTPEIF